MCRREPAGPEPRGGCAPCASARARGAAGGRRRTKVTGGPGAAGGGGGAGVVFLLITGLRRELSPLPFPAAPCGEQCWGRPPCPAGERGSARRRRVVVVASFSSDRNGVSGQGGRRARGWAPSPRSSCPVRCGGGLSAFVLRCRSDLGRARGFYRSLSSS